MIEAGQSLDFAAEFFRSQASGATFNMILMTTCLDKGSSSVADHPKATSSNVPSEPVAALKMTARYAGS